MADSDLSSTGAVALHIDLTEGQLEAQKRLEREGSLLPEQSQTSAVTASENEAQAVGRLLEVTVETEGVPTLAMVDTGAQSTILSRSAFHDVVWHLQKTDQKVPSLELPTANCVARTDRRVASNCV